MGIVGNNLLGDMERMNEPKMMENLGKDGEMNERSKLADLLAKKKVTIEWVSQDRLRIAVI
jgi:hypothetical protein